MIGFQVFTASGTYTPNASATSAIVHVIGGGGAGGGANSTDTVHGAGGAGAAASVLFTDTLTSTTITIGAGGTPASPTAADGTVGGTGGTTSFGTTCIAVGGGGGIGRNNNVRIGPGAKAGGGARSSGTGDLRFNGHHSTAGNLNFNWGDATHGGMGGMAAMAYSGRAWAGHWEGDGGGGRNYGGGGGGACVNNGTQTGGAGESGVVVVFEYGGYRLLRTIEFTASGTYTPSADCKTALIMGVGAGGGGGSADVTNYSNPTFAAGSGGGSGATVLTFMSSPSSQTVTIGAGSAGLAAGSTDSATASQGGDTTVGSILDAQGGFGGVGRNNTANGTLKGSWNRNGGLAANCVGDLILEGGAGGQGMCGSDIHAANGDGGIAPLVGGEGGRGRVYTGAGLGPIDNGGYGGGGGGAAVGWANGSYAGGDGSDGYVIIYEFG